MARRSPDLLPCARVLEMIEGRLSGSLPVGLDAAVDAHLAGCAACRAELELASSIRGELAALPSFDAPPQMIDALRRRVREAPSSSARLAAGNARRGLKLRFTLAAAAAASAVVAAAVLLPHRAPQPPPVSSVDVARATAEARFAFALVAHATAVTRHELRQEALRARLVGAVTRSLVRSLPVAGRSSGAQDPHATPRTNPGGSS